MPSTLPADPIHGRARATGLPVSLPSSPGAVARTVGACERQEAAPACHRGLPVPRKMASGRDRPHDRDPIRCRSIGARGAHRGDRRRTPGRAATSSTCTPWSARRLQFTNAVVSVNFGVQLEGTAAGRRTALRHVHTVEVWDRGPYRPPGLSGARTPHHRDQGPWPTLVHPADAGPVDRPVRGTRPSRRLAKRRLRRGSTARTDTGLWLHRPPNGPVVFDPSLQTAAELMVTTTAGAGLPPPGKAA